MIDAAFADAAVARLHRADPRVAGLRARADVRRGGRRRARRLHDAELGRGRRAERLDPDADGGPARPAARGSRDAARPRRDRGRRRARRALVLVEGVPSYYPRFGFRSASELGFERPDARIPERRGWRCRSPRTTRPSAAASSTRTSSRRRRRMPELPEVESVRRAIAPALEGRRLDRVEIDDVRLTRPEDPLEVAAELTGERVEHVDRRGKYLIVRFASGRALLIHLRMTGSLLRDPAEATHVRAVLRLDDGSEVGYRDVRRFGTWLLLEPGELEPYLDGALGEEPLVAAFTAKGLGERLARAQGAVEGGPARPADARRAREHLRRRGALVREAPSAAAGGIARRGTSCAASTARSGRRSSSGSRARARRSRTTASRTAPRATMQKRVPRLRPHRRAVRPLRHAAREDPRRRPRHLVLPALSDALTEPALDVGGCGRGFCAKTAEARTCRASPLS